MSTANETASSSLPEPKKNAALERKWGKESLRDGYTIVPVLLLKEQHRLEISSSQLCVLLHLLSFWFDPDSQQWAAKSVIATRIGITERQLQRQIKDLEEKGLVTRVQRKTNHGTRANGHDFSGLVKQLKRLAKEADDGLPKQARKAQVKAKQVGR